MSRRGDSGGAHASGRHRLGYVLAVVLLLALPAAAQHSTDGTPEESTPGGDGASSRTIEHADRGEHPRFHLDWESELHGELTVFDPDTLFPAPTSRELRLALWHSPMGRLHYDMTAAEAMLGRDGLVRGGRMLGVGLGSTAFGYQPSSPTERWLSGTRWNQLSRQEKIQIGVEATVAAGVLWAVLSNL